MRDDYDAPAWAWLGYFLGFVGALLLLGALVGVGLLILGSWGCCDSPLVAGASTGRNFAYFSADQSKPQSHERRTWRSTTVRRWGLASQPARTHYNEKDAP